jgi:hypothetical protein
MQEKELDSCRATSEPRPAVGMSLSYEIDSKMVARDGIEPPTPAFSGRASPSAMSLIRFALVIIIALKPAVLLE